MCVGCAAAYAAIAASTVSFSLSDINGKESAFNFNVSSDALEKAAMITTTPTGLSAMTITQPQEKVSAALMRGSIDRTSQKAV
jgi:hypothetical protein